MDTTPNTPRDPLSHTSTLSNQRNPYARVPSRRAIACATCAKAKTKCNKALPSCSRCITKGIKCEPRSTRRTSDNNYRSNVKKPSRPPRRHCPASVASRLDFYTPSMSLPSSQGSAISYAASYIDTEATAKVGHRAIGYPSYTMLAPPSPHYSQVFTGGYAYVDSPEHDSDVFTQSVGTKNYVNLDETSPQTPNADCHHQPVPVVHDADHFWYPQSRSNELLMPIEFGFGFDVVDLLPKMWATPDATTIAQVAQIPWHLPDYSDLSQQTLGEPVLHAVDIASPAQYHFGHVSGQVHPGWTFYGPPVADMNIVSSAPFIQDFNIATGHPSTWEVAFTS